MLADEINRAPAKVQSALLEAMAERQVSVGGTTYPLPEPFLVLATQNPIESEGVYALPEAQRDRFLMKVDVAYPGADDELAILQRMSVAPPRPGELLTIDAGARPAGRGRPGLRAPRRRAVRRGAGDGHPRAGALRRRRDLGARRVRRLARAPPSAWSPRPGRWP